MEEGFLKSIHIGKYIEARMMELKLDEARICRFLNVDSKTLSELKSQVSVDTKHLLGLSKILQYDFFRLYSQHLIFYSPLSADVTEDSEKVKTNLPRFRKNIYTQELIDFVLSQIHSNNKSIKQIVEEYRIPKTTLYKWLSKHK